MPLPEDEQTVKTGADLITALKGLFGKHPGFRPAHAKGAILTGTFTPTTLASTLSTAPHFSSPSTPLTIRFSSSTGIPNIPDTDSNADPRGIALRFHLPSVNSRRAHTDIIAHSTPTFPTRTGAEFLEFLQAAAASGPGVEEPTPIQKFLGGSPSALRHVTSAKPAPVGWGTQEYFSVSAFKLISSSGKETFIRYHVVPEAGVQTLTDSEKSGKSADYLSEELAERIKKGPIGFKLLAQVAAEGDVTDDATVSWPSDREVVELGTVKIEKLVDGEESAEEQKKIIFDPIPRVEGVEASKDPLLEVRAGLYLLSGRERRAGTA